MGTACVLNRNGLPSLVERVRSTRTVRNASPNFERHPVNLALVFEFSCVCTLSVHDSLAGLGITSSSTAEISGRTTGTIYYFPVSVFHGVESPCSNEVVKPTYAASTTRCYSIECEMTEPLATARCLYVSIFVRCRTHVHERSILETFFSTLLKLSLTA